MGREQLRGCSRSLLMQENQVRQGSTHPTSQSRQFRGGLPTTSHHVDTYRLPSCGCLPPPIMWIPTTSHHVDTHYLPSCGYPLSLVDGAAAALSYTFIHGNDASLHLTFPLPTWSCSLTSMRRLQLLILGGSEVHYAASFLTPYILGFAAHLRSLHRLGPLSGRFVLRGVRPNSINFAIYAYIPSLRMSSREQTQRH